MAQLWLYVSIVLQDEPSRPAILAQGKFFSRAGQKFFLKAMRLADVPPTLDLSQKLVLRYRLEGLYEAHSTALVLNETQAESVLDLATYTGFHALVELAKPSPASPISSKACATIPLSWDILSTARSPPTN
jgi:hypothetical protein